MADTTAGRPQRTSWAVWVPVVLGYLVLLVLFPVPMLAIGMLVAAVLMCASIYVLWTQSHSLRPARRLHADRNVTRVLLAVVGVGAAAAFLWPEETAIVAFAASVSACVTWFVLEQTFARRPHR